MEKIICIIGSGPSGIACAHTLLKEGHQVMLLDVGLTMEAEPQKLLDKYQIDQDTDAFLKNIHILRRAHHKHSKIQAGKSIFGSDFPYRDIPETSVLVDDQAVVRSSLAKGGLSNVWGATVSTVSPKDINGWPVTFEELKPY